ncbi:MAG TPA: reverse transcriptase family protein, partial [Candidatus Dojkabacteria bacterium]|nr:reverse transcriptase family protein [Candidatus Dojkabacteria bacterium]
MPLNKVFPNTSTRKEMRPIAVQSPFVKLLEARFLPKLQKYMNERLDRSQIGFVPKLGIQVNLVRALERITLRTNSKKTAYGLFIDFSNAYNSIPHELLFKKLRQKQVLDDDEVLFLEQLYARYKTRIGKKTLKSNKGVAQGSVISPALFNIYIEDLSDELKEKANIDIEDLLYYADDLLTLCDSEEQLKKAINAIADWSERTGMLLNKKKSGIIIFAGRRATKIPMMKTSNLKEPNSKTT